jgi:hypothetical protein
MQPANKEYKRHWFAHRPIYINVTKTNLGGLLRGFGRHNNMTLGALTRQDWMATNLAYRPDAEKIKMNSQPCNMHMHEVKSQ